MLKRIDQAQEIIIYGTVLLFPLFVIPSFAGVFQLNHIILLSFSVVSLAILKSIKTILNGKLAFNSSKFDFGALLLLVAFILSALLRTPNKYEAFFFPGVAIFTVLVVIFYFFLNQESEKTKKEIPLFLALGAGLAGIVSFLAGFGFLSTLDFLPSFVKQNGFSPFGGYLSAVVYLLMLIPLLTGNFFIIKEEFHKYFSGLLALLVFIVFCFNLFIILPGKEFFPKIPTNQTSWYVLVDTLKESPLFGSGAGNYLTSFNRFRPITYNNTSNWSLRFASASNYYFTVITETGLLGFLGLMVLAFFIYRERIEKFSLDSKIISLIFSLLLFALVPASFANLFLFFVILSLNANVKRFSLNLITTESDNIVQRFPAFLFILPVVFLIGYYLFFMGKAVYAESVYSVSLSELSKNNATKTYDLMRKAITTNPKIDRYRISFSQLNFALANNIAGNKKESLSEEDKTTISELVKQTILEAKAAVSLNPQRSGNWALLAETYKALMAYAKESDQFAISSYEQAIALDPYNPSLRLSLGGIHYSLKNYQKAIDVFQLAVLSKPDLANARYNLAVALRDKGDYEGAYNQMTYVLSLVDPNSNDYEIAKKELENLESKRPTKQTSANPQTGGEGENLTPPEPQASPVLKPKLDLTEEQTPPQPVVSPTPVPVPSPEATLVP